MRKASSTPTATPCRLRRAAAMRWACATRSDARHQGLRRACRQQAGGARSPPTTCSAAPRSCCRCSSAIRRSRARRRKSSPRPRRAKLVDTAREGSLRPLALRRPALRGNALLDYLIEKAEERQRKRQAKEMSRKTATRKLRLPGKLADCSRTTPRRHGDLPGRGRQRRRLRQAGPQPRNPGDPAPARQDPERGQRQRRQDARRTRS